MSAPELLTIQENQLPRIVNSVCITIVTLALIYTSYSYLLMRLEGDQKPLIQEAQTLRVQLKEEKEKRLTTEQENTRFKFQIEEKEKLLKKLSTQLEKGNKESSSSPGESDTQACPLAAQDVDKGMIHNALRETLSRKAAERFEGVAILMNNMDYLDEKMQREVVDFYLREVDKRNRDGVYYATFILSELKPKVLREYQAEIAEVYSFIDDGSGWEKTLYKYCQIESKINSQ